LSDRMVFYFLNFFGKENKPGREVEIFSVV
jgi:hypothetical protein